MNIGIRFFFLVFLLQWCDLGISQNIFPGSTGFGTHSRAAYGGEEEPIILYVSNLKNDGKGSLREAVSKNFPRIIVFNISGTIRLKKPLYVTNPYVFVAGQSSPASGISVEGAPLIVQTHDVLFQDMRFRLGSHYPLKSDCVSITGTEDKVYNVVFDHCSFAFGLDENIGILNAGPGITISNSIIGYALNKFDHSCGLLAMNSEKISLIANIFAFNFDRNPNIRGDSRDVEILNNLIYNSGSHAIYFGSRGPSNLPVRGLIEGNLYITGPDNLNRFLLSVHQYKADTFHLFWSDNVTIHDRNVYRHHFNQVHDQSGRFLPELQRPFGASLKNLIPAEKLEALILHRVGARPGCRDWVDSLIVSNIENRIGHIIVTEADIIYRKPLPVVQKRFKVPDDPHQIGITGFSNLQVYLQKLIIKRCNTSNLKSY
ncbi:pectate lyase [Thermophagus sp. OGC60D27]|uniref:pectate lyase n=1 Tax=Thermophagus sp. OGC60D27 TaxID=3458415 RepID=UPI004037CEC7